MNSFIHDAFPIQKNTNQHSFADCSHLTEAITKNSNIERQANDSPMALYQLQLTCLFYSPLKSQI